MPSPPSPDLETELGKARDLGIDACGRIAEFWGFTRTMGRAFGLLYLSHEPLPQSEIQKRLSISAGSASMTLAALGRWGVVHRVWVRGQRREHYQAETDFWKMISGVLNERERREIGAAVEVVERAEAGARAVHAAVKTATTGAPKRLRGEAEFTVDRLVKLGEICRLGETMLDMLLGQLTLDVGRFRDVLKGDQGTPEGPSAPPAAPANVAAVPASRPAAASPSHRPATREKKPRR
ncbi:MAG: HTH-type transcriptional regulator, glycine betaine synthesis regulator [Myxococcales bacterium]|nr:HTH-type transcriptional regulator, glycine betaine synthesis regulator [Myxococcales bacterium]